MKTCSQCRYWSVIGPTQKGGWKAGTCRGGPPTVVGNTSAFPQTRDIEPSCRAFRRRQSTEEAA